MLFLGMAEVGYRVARPQRYYVWPPHFQRTAHTADVIAGVAGPSRFTINALGMRGDPLPRDPAYHLLAVGGSTTICAYLDDAEAWPRLVQSHLTDALGSGTAWVGNVGRPGHTTAQHKLQMEKLLEQHDELDAVILLIGINDMLIHLAVATDGPGGLMRAGGRLRPGAPGRAFSIHPEDDAGDPWYLRNAFGRVWRLHAARAAETGLSRMDDRGAMVGRMRAARQRATSFRDELPDLSKKLATYARNVNEILDLAERSQVRVLLLTQPTLWRKDLTPDELGLIWASGGSLHHIDADATFYSAGALTRAMKMYNDALLAVCRERSVDCLDAAEQLPRTAEIFFDDAHYTEEGSRRLARLVAEHLLEHEPLSRRRVAP